MPDQPTPEASATGKQVFLGDRPIADAYSEFDAELIVGAINNAARYRKSDAGVTIAAYLDSLAERTRQRGMARAFRIAADGVRAGFWKGDGE